MKLTWVECVLIVLFVVFAAIAGSGNLGEINALMGR